MSPRPTSLLPEAFSLALGDLADMRWHPNINTQDMGAPQRIAPYSNAIAAEFISPAGDALATGRLVVLYNPAGDDSWDSTFRLVSYIQAPIELAMAADPLLPDVAWSWLVDALAHHGADCVSLAGTVTASYGRSFGDMRDDPDRGDVEMRASWSPEVPSGHWLSQHLHSWQELLLWFSGQPPLPDGVIHFPQETQ
ncbi:MAG: hypothetical protein CSA64_01745 [Arachnia propionica]|nr:MAG: hypothetical protein CSA64_01745 [Arachnia propionica]